MAELKTDATAPENVQQTKKADEYVEKPEKSDKPDPSEPDDDDMAKAAQVNAEEIVTLCEIARRPDLIGGYIKNKTTLAQVRKELLAGQATEQQAAGSIGHHVSMSGINPTDQLDSMAKTRAAATGKSYSSAYADVLRANPKLYVQYLDQKDAALGVKR